jgi:hypothetical protein
MNRVNTRATTEPVEVPAPIGGLNGRDAITAMSPVDAYRLDNYEVGISSVKSRKGSIVYNDTALVAATKVETVEVYAGADGDQMLAWCGAKVFDVSLPTQVELATGKTSAKVITAMFSNASDNSQHMIIVSGHDTPYHYDGGTISNLTMTGITTPADLNYVFTFKERLYFGAINTLGFYYLPVGQIQGALEYFDLAQVSRSGGYLLAIASYSEGGETPQDYIVFITSKGEFIVYAGSDPSNVNAWALVGRYFSSTPIGPRCAYPYAGDLLVLTFEGALSFTNIKRNGDANAGGVAQSEIAALTSKLGTFYTDLIGAYDTHGWHIVHYPRSSKLIINVPAISGLTFMYQFVMNTVTGSWSRYTSWDAQCFTVYNGRLYFGSVNGDIFLADEGFVVAQRAGDVDIPCYSSQAFNKFNIEYLKHFQWATLSAVANSFGSAILDIDLLIWFSVDFIKHGEFVTSGEYTIKFPYSTTAQGVRRVPITLNSQGMVGSLGIQYASNGENIAQFEWFSTQFGIEPTASLLP